MYQEQVFPGSRGRDSMVNLGFMFLNIQGMREKVEILLEFGCMYNFMCLSEHWLSCEEIDFYIPDGYYLGAYFCRNLHKNGGVAILVQNSIDCIPLDLDWLNLEFHFEICGIVIEQLSIVLLSLYRSPDGCAELFLNNLEKLLDFVTRPKWQSYQIIFGGDVNAAFDVNEQKKSVLDLKNLLCQYGYNILNHKPTRLTACLDNAFSNVGNDNFDVIVSKFPFSDHELLGLNSSFLKPPHLLNSHVSSCNDRWDYTPGPENTVTTCYIPRNSFSYITDSLAAVDWDNLLLSSDGAVNANCTFDLFFNKMVNILNTFGRLKTTIINNSFKLNNNRPEAINKAWYTDDLRVMKDYIMYLDGIFKQTKNEIVKDIKKVSITRYKKGIVEAKKVFNSNLIESSSNKCKTAWSIINNAKNNAVNKNTAQSISPDVFNNFFVNSVKEIKNKIDEPSINAVELVENHQVLNTVFKWVHITPVDIINVVIKMKNSVSLDYYGMSNALMKSIIVSIAQPLAFCFNSCLIEGIFPDPLKIAKVCPIYKSGPKEEPNSYRPVSLVPVVGKIFESLICEQLVSYMDCNNLFCKSQFGFRRGRSTVQAVDCLIRGVLDAFESRSFAQATFCDLSRAFDCIDHRMLLEKLLHYGVHGLELDFFQSYLSNRTQLVSFKSKNSSVLPVDFGVPQGSILGPLLFLIAVNDLPFNVNANCFMYADDTTFLNVNNDFNVLNTLVSNTLEEASSWFRANGLLLNDAKTKQLTFSLRPIPEGEVSEPIKFLGIFVDRHLSWASHVDYISARLSKAIYLFRRLKDIVTCDFLRSAYFAFFQSIISYGLVLWGNSSRIEDILILQKKVVRVMANSDRLAHCKPLFVDLKILTVINLYIFEIVKYMINDLPNLTLRSNVHSYKTRNMNCVNYEYCRLSKSLRSHSSVGLRIFNKVSSLINISCGRNRLDKFYDWLQLNPFYSLDEFMLTKVCDMNF